jgi:monofunctional biosynthetic peptidoglycan transglycosylase
LALPLLWLLATVLQVLVLRFVDPPFSAFMAARQVSAWRQGDWDYGVVYDWRVLCRIAPSLPLALVAS